MPLNVSFCTAEETNTDAKAAVLLRDVKRIVFLGDSITQAGNYVTDLECWLISQRLNIEVLNLGLGSETVTPLTEGENAGHLKSHGFGRPCLSERLDRVLAASHPDLVIACYGMNDGLSLPPDEPSLNRFSAAVSHLREAALKAGAKRIIICTPPVCDRKGKADESHTNFTTWLLAKRADGWEVVDIHTPMKKALDESRVKDPAFKFAEDGVHPNREGHWLMAREILLQSFGAKLEGVTSAEELFPAHGAEIRKLVFERMQVMFGSWMTEIGHKRPKVSGGPEAKPGLPMAQANARGTEIEKKSVRKCAEKHRIDLKANLK